MNIKQEFLEKKFLMPLEKEVAELREQVQPEKVAEMLAVSLKSAFEKTVS